MNALDPAFHSVIQHSSTGVDGVFTPLKPILTANATHDAFIGLSVF
jgi:hypothetical protein